MKTGPKTPAGMGSVIEMAVKTNLYSRNLHRTLVNPTTVRAATCGNFRGQFADLH